MTLALQDAFRSEPDERGVLSIAAVRDDPRGSWTLTHASLLIVPAACAESSWPAWRAMATDGDWKDTSGLPAELVHQEATWMLGRAVLSLDEASEWFRELQTHPSLSGEGPVPLPAVAAFPPVLAELTAPSAVVHVFPGTDLPVSGLSSGLFRPARTLFWGATTQRDFPELRSATVKGAFVSLPTRDLAGMHLGQWICGDRLTPSGVLVGRAARRAWIVAGKGGAEYKSYSVTLGWDPTRIDLAELELSYIARLDGAIVLATRVRLQDLDLAEVRGDGRCSVTFDAIGPKLTHEVVLQTSSGEHLDEMGPYGLVEKIVTEVRLMTDTGPSQHAFTSEIGGDAEFPALEDILARQLEIERINADDLLAAAQRRLIATRAGALAQLRAALTHARGELLVLDPYFGQHRDEWRLLDGFTGPIRVLTSNVEREQARPGSQERPTRKALLPMNLDARYRRKNSGMHERAWIWQGGGISLGSSPSSFGRAPVQVRSLSPAEAETFRTDFEQLWADPLFRPVPRLAGSRRRVRDRQPSSGSR